MVPYRAVPQRCWSATWFAEFYTGKSWQKVRNGQGLTIHYASHAAALSQAKVAYLNGQMELAL